MKPGTPAWACALRHGFTEESVRVFRFGFVSQWLKGLQRANFGLAPGRQGREDLSVPPGLLVPSFDASGNLCKLRVFPFGPSSGGSYYLPGSRSCVVLTRTPSLPCILFGNDLDAYLAAQAGADIAGAVSLGDVGRRLEPEVSRALRSAASVVDALGTDEAADALRTLVRTALPDVTLRPAPPGFHAGRPDTWNLTAAAPVQTAVPSPSPGGPAADLNPSKNSNGSGSAVRPGGVARPGDGSPDFEDAPPLEVPADAWDERREADAADIVGVSQAAYSDAPQSVRQALDVLAVQPAFFALRCTAHGVKAFNVRGNPAPAAQVFLDRNPIIADWCGRIPGKAWQPWPEGGVWYSEEELAGGGEMRTSAVF